MQNQTPLNELLPALAECGFSFIRILANDKRPDGRWKNAEDRISADEALSRISNGTNYGIVPPEGCFILDFDSDDAYQRSVQKDASIEKSLTFKTPRGFHVLFEGEGIPQGASHTYLGQGVDVRAGERGYVVGPGSTRTDGRYEILSGDEIIVAPDSLRALLQKPAQSPSTPPVQESAVSPAASPTTPVAPPVAPSSAQTEGTRSLSIIERGKAARKHWKVLDEAQEGERNDTIARAACGLGSLYADAEPEKRTEIYAKLMDHADRLGDGDAAEIRQNRTTATNQWYEGMKSPATRLETPDTSSRYRLIFPQFDIQEFEQVFENLNISVRNNQETKKVEFLILDDGSWPIPRNAFRFEVDNWFESDEMTSDTIIGNINRYFGKQRGESVIGVSIPDTKFKVWTTTLASANPVRPFLEWIGQCEPNPVLEGLTLDNWLNPWLTNPESDLVRWTTRAIIIGIVQRVYGDKQAYRIIPVLRGEKAIGKTTLVNQLLPESFQHLFGQFQVNSRTAEMVGALNGKFLCEAGELAGMNDNKASIFKAFIGNAVNTSRQPYGRVHLDYRNTAFIIGTTNPERNVPNDDALRSRLVFMDLQKGPDPKEYLPDRLEHLFALAREAYLAGERVGVLPEHLEAEQYQASDESIIVNLVWDDRLRSFDWRDTGEYFTLSEIMVKAGFISRWSVKAPPGAEKATRDYLKMLGVGVSRNEMKMKTKNGKRQWYFRESNEIKRIRDEQIKALGKKEKGPFDLNDL